MSSLLPMRAASESILAPDVRDVIQWESLFVNAFDRDLVGSGAAHYNPNYFHQVPRLFTEFMDIAVAMICVSRVDRHGYMSLGTNVDTNKAAIEAAGIVLAEVNEQMPRVHGDSWVHVSELDAIVEHDAPLPELPVAPERPEDEAIGQLIGRDHAGRRDHPARHRRRAERPRQGADRTSQPPASTRRCSSTRWWT